jgi:hypothetical protein
MVALAWWLYLGAGPFEDRKQGNPAVGWTLVGAAFAAVAAIVVWVPSLVVGLLIQIVATVALAAGVGMLYRRSTQ